MTSRGVRFASSRDAYADDDGTYALDGSFGDQRRPSLNTAIEATLRPDWPTHLQNHNNNNNSRRTSTDSSQPSAAMATHVAVATPDVAAVASSAIEDGPSLAMALTQSIRHHSKMIDGQQTPHNTNTNTNTRPNNKPGSKQQPILYDPYNDDDHESLAPEIELNYEKDAKESSLTPAQESNALVPALRDYIANAGVEDATSKHSKYSSHRTVEQQQVRVEEILRNNAYDSFTTRFTKNITNWFGLGHDEEEPSQQQQQQQQRTVRFADDNNNGEERDDDVGSTNSDVIAAAIANGESVDFPVGSAAFGRAPKFVIPPNTSFRTATRHPSHLPASAEYDNMENRLNAPRRVLAARKRHRRNDSVLRLMIAIFCLGLSLIFAIRYGEGQFGLAITSKAYERKVINQYGALPDTDYNAQEAYEKDNVFYPSWWESEKGIPDMEAMNIQFNPTIEYHVADVTSKRAPDRIETPYFWFVPKSGGNVIRTIMRSCLRLAEASEFGTGSDEPFLLIKENDERRYVNVDMTTARGLARAKDLKLASSGVADVVISNDIHGVLDIFNNRNRARAFAVLRHPMERAISKYYSDLASDPEVAGMTLPQYVRSGGLRVENNYLTRFLSGRYGGKLGVQHLNLAREFLRRKFVVGLASDIPATANLFSRVYGWNNTAASLGLKNVDLCYDSIFDALKTEPPPSVEEGSEGWKLLVAQNWFDFKVYEYAEHLFQEQVEQLKLTSSGVKTNDEGVTERE